MTIAIIGAGAYGCYSAKVLSESFPNASITIIDVGDQKIKSESSIGYKSNILLKPYLALSKGRFFGLGGSTARWGGQILLFSQRDFKNPTPFLRDIIELNEKYKNKVLTRFGFCNIDFDKAINSNLLIKTGYWLNYFKRNLFRYFKITKLKNITILSNTRVIRVNTTDGKFIDSITCIKDGKKNNLIFEHYFLTAGAFESIGLLMKSNLIDNNKPNFSDHLSFKAFKIYGGTKIGNTDFAFRFNKFSLVTKRLIGEVDDLSYFVNPIFNLDNSFFQNLKEILFKAKWNKQLFKSAILDIPSVAKFFYNLFILKRIYVHKSEWYLFIDIENFLKTNFFKLSGDLDNFHEKAIDIHFDIDQNLVNSYNKIKSIVRDFLLSHNVDFQEFDLDSVTAKLEDTYHPYGMYSHFPSAATYFSTFNNMLVINTGVLPRAGSINPTAAGFPLIEEYVCNFMQD